MAGDSRTEAPTPRKRSEARKKGQVARSVEITSVMVLFVALTVLQHIGPDLLGRYRDVAREAFLQVGNRTAEPEALLVTACSLMWASAAAMAPLMVAVAIMGAGMNLLQVGPMLTLQPIQPDWNRISPWQGVKRLCSARSLVELAKSLTKFAVMTLVASTVIRERFSELEGLQGASAESAIAGLGNLMMEIGLKCGLALLVMAAADFAYQRHSFESGLKMTKRELKDEFKQSEGDPHIRGKIRQRARQMASRRMMQSVPTADVVVTNPVHLAVALEYRPERLQAPVVVAKGQLLVAERIKQLAKEHGVPVLENPPLAQALYRSVEIGMVIPPALYEAVAEVLAFIYRLREQAHACAQP